MATSFLSEPNSLIENISEIVKSPVILTKFEIKSLVANIGNEIEKRRCTKNLELFMLSTLPEDRTFTKDLIAQLKSSTIQFNHRLIYLYKDDQGKIKDLNRQIKNQSLSGKSVLIINTLVNTGKTLNEIKETVTKAGAEEVSTVALINKYSDCDRKADIVGLDLYLDRKAGEYSFFGYAMNYDGLYNEFEYIGWVKKEACAKDAEAVGFDEGPKPGNGIDALKCRNISVLQDVLRDETKKVLIQYSENEGTIYNARRGIAHTIS